MPFFVRSFFLVLIALVLAGCPLQNERPIQEIAPVSVPQLPISNISIPLEISSLSLAKTIAKELPQPLLAGKTKEMGLQLWIKEKEASEKSIWDYLSQPVIKWIDRAVPVSAQMLYVVKMKNFKLRFEGNKLYVEALIQTQTELKIKNGIPFFDANKKNASSLLCPAEASLKLQGKIEITKDARLKITLDEKDAHLKFTKICSNKVLKSIDYPALLQKIVAPIQTKIRQTTSQIISTQIKKALKSQQKNLSFGEEIEQIAEQVSEPYLLQKDIWLQPNVQQIFISPFEGKGSGKYNKLHFSVGVQALPTVVMTSQKPLISSSKKINFTVKKTKNEANIYVQAKISLSDAAQQLEVFLKDYVDKYYAKHGYTIGQCSIYPSQNKAVVEIEVLQKKTNKRKAMLYLAGIPKYDANQKEIYLEELEFTSKTKNILAKFAKWLLQPNIMKQLETNTRFSLSQNLIDLQKQLNNFEIKQDLGLLKGNFDYVAVNNVFITASHFELFLQAKGKLRFEVKF